MGFRAILFDLDGTLLDTLKDLALSMNAVLMRHGYPEHPTDSYRFFVGNGIEVLVKRTLPEKERTDDRIKQIVSEVSEEYRRRWADHTKPYPGVPQMLTALEQKYIPKVIFSNKPHEFTVLTVETLLPQWHFREVLGIKPWVPPKPDPGAALRIARDMGIAPREFVYLGDTNTDMQTALAAGMYPVGAVWGFRSAGELKESGAAMLARSPLDVLTFF